MEFQTTHASFIRKSDRIGSAMDRAGASFGLRCGIGAGGWLRAEGLGKGRAGIAAGRNAGAGASREERHDCGHDGIPIGAEVATFGEYQSASRGSDHEDFFKVRRSRKSRTAAAGN